MLSHIIVVIVSASHKQLLHLTLVFPKDLQQQFHLSVVTKSLHLFELFSSAGVHPAVSTLFIFSNLQVNATQAFWAVDLQMVTALLKSPQCGLCLSSSMCWNIVSLKFFVDWR